MIPELNPENIGQTLGVESVGSAVQKVEEYCAYEERRITLVNEPKILSLRAQIAVLQDEERTLEERLKSAQPPGDIKNRRRKAAYYWTITILLAVAAFVFSLLAFDPFRLGWKSYLYCLGIAIVTPFLIEEVIERWNLAGLVKTFATVAGAAALLSLIFLAVIRGNLLAHEVDSTNQVVISDDADAASAPAPQNDFYKNTLALLQLAMILLAVAMELGAGLALNRAWRTTEDSGEDWKALYIDLRNVRERMVALATEAEVLRKEPAVFAARFWRNFYHAMLTHTVRNAMTKLSLGIVLLGLLAFHGRAAAEEKTTIVIAVDLTQSVAAKGPDGKTDFEKNIEGVTRVLGQVPINCRVSVIGITDQSFARPYILLSASVTDDPGYFAERLEKARAELIRRWKNRSANLKPDYRSTDILGALVIAGQLFDESSSASLRVLVVFSDMRHATRDVNLESPLIVPAFAGLEHSRAVPLVHLRGTNVYLLGVGGSGKTAEYWQGLERFWRDYFMTAGSTVCSYSPLRSLTLAGCREDAGAFNHQ